MIGGLVRIVLLVLFVAVAAGLLFLFVPAVGDVSGRAFGSAVANEADVDRDGRCTRTGDRTRRCTVGSFRYDLTVRDRNCFRAERTDGGSSPPVQRVDGCAKLRDQVGPADAALDAVGF